MPLCTVGEVQAPVPARMRAVKAGRLQQLDDPWGETEDAFVRLLTAARDGEDWAWEQIYARFSPFVLGYLRSQAAAGAEELSGQLFLRVVRTLHAFDGDEAAFRFWIITLTHRLVVAARRGHGVPRDESQPLSLDPGLAATSVEPKPLDGLSADDLVALLGILPDEQRDVLLLRLLGDLTVSEVGQAVGKRAAAVRALLRLALRNLQQALEGSGSSSVGDRQAGS